MAERSEFGDLLRRHRVAVRLTQEQLAARAQLSSRTVGDLERGRVRRPQPPSVRLLADALGLHGDVRAAFEQTAHDEYWSGRIDTGAPAVRGAGPAQLPPDVTAFTGRVAELARLGDVLDGGHLAVVAGAGGVGKTALAVHWAHRVRDRFPDGQLFANLYGFAVTPPARPIEVLTRFLHALGVPPEQVPLDAEEAAALYRSMLADRRVLVVLDNAADAEQVRPLLPGGPHCRVLITSRDDMAGLVARDGARRLPLAVLAEAEAHGLLGRLLGPARIAADPADVAALARLCAHLPLALRIAAAILDRDGYRAVADYVIELRGEDRLGALAVDGDPGAAVRAAFDLSYAKLPEPARRLFRLVGAVPGPDVTVTAAAALLDVDAVLARRLLGRLTDAYLLERVAGAARFTCHDLLREYARERAAAEETVAGRVGALDRLFAYYLRTAAAAAALLDPGKLRLPRDAGAPDAPAAGEPHDAGRVPEGTAEPIADGGAALAWLDAEHPNLVAAVMHAAAHGRRRTAWLIADSLRGYDRRRLHAADWPAVAHTALAAATAEGAADAQTSCHVGLGLLHVRAGSYDAGIEHYRQALALARRTGWLEAEAAVRVNLGAAHSDLGQLAESAEHLGRALRIWGHTGSPARTAAALNNLGLTLGHLGRSTDAVAHLSQAVALHRQGGYPAGAAIALANLAALCHDIGRSAEALRHLGEALALCNGTQDQLLRAMALGTLAEIHRDAGRFEEALEAATTAVELARELRGRRFEAGAMYQLARTRHRSGQHDEAVALYEEALRLARAGHDRLPELDILIGLAEAGAGPDTIANAEQAVALAARHGYRLREGRARTVLAALHLQAGDRGRAVHQAELALKIQREVPDPRGAAETTTMLARLVDLRRLHAQREGVVVQAEGGELGRVGRQA